MGDQTADELDGFWKLIHTATGVIIKPFIRNILAFYGLDNLLFFASINEVQLEAAENFSRAEMHWYIENESQVDLKDFYGIYAKYRSKENRTNIGLQTHHF